MQADYGEREKLDQNADKVGHMGGLHEGTSLSEKDVTEGRGLQLRGHRWDPHCGIRIPGLV